MNAEARPKPLLSVRETAELLGWKLSRTYEATRRREIPGLVEINGRLLYRRRVVEAWLSGELPSLAPR
jgi:predicted DNA-binding transcriptional regulator AlpA